MIHTIRERIPFFVPILLGAFVVAGAGIRAGSIEEPVVVDKAVQPLVTTECFERFAVDLILEGTRPEVPVDVMLVLDHSGSMDDAGDGCTIPGIDNQPECEGAGGAWGPQPITSEKEAAKLFVDLLFADDRVGLVAYGSHATLDAALTFDGDTVKTAIDAIAVDGYTNIAEALQVAREELEMHGRPEAMQVLVVFTDGVANRSTDPECLPSSCGSYPCAPTCCTEEAVAQAALAKAGGAVIFGIFLPNVAIADDGCSIAEVLELGEETLRSISSGPDFFFVPQSPEELLDIFEAIASLVAPSGRDLVVTEEVAPEFVLLPETIDPTPDSVVGNSIVWSFDILGDETRTFRFEIERASPLTPPGNYFTSSMSKVEFTDPDGDPRSLDFPDRTAGLFGERCACEGQGRAVLLGKGRCDVGAPLKFKLASSPYARYRLLADRGAGPIVLPGIGTFCLDFSPNRVVVAQGTLNAYGFRSAFGAIPNNPDLVGEEFAFQFAALDGEAPNGVAVSNGIVITVCPTGGSECDTGIRRLGYATVVPHDGVFPVTVTQRAFRTGVPGESLGEVSLVFDPSDPSTLPAFSEGEGLVVTEIHPFPGHLVVHAFVKGCGMAGDILPDATTFETQAGGFMVSRSIDTSCATPIGPMVNFNPIFPTLLEDAAVAPPCE